MNTVVKSEKMNLELEYDPETHQYVAACPELDLTVAGDSEDEAIEELIEAKDYLERLIFTT